jgi:TatD DNase family protein
VIIDSHAHLNFPEFRDDLETVLANATTVGVDGMINIGTDIKTSRESVLLAESYPQIFATVGIHPHDAASFSEVEAELRKLAQHPRVIGIGEIGLDYFRNPSPADTQKAAFISQLKMALELGKPVVLHCRDAYDDLLAVVSKFYLPFCKTSPGIIHSFSGDITQANSFVQAGWLLGINNLITYPKNDFVRDAIKDIPLDKLVVETDCPFLPPQSLRGQRCEPAHTLFVIETIAELKNLSVDEVATATTANLQTLFNISWQ